MGLFSKRHKINLALQGGGAHGAFTWGVLDRLLEEENIEFGWISATSAGAVNAVALASGWARGGRERARKNLKEVWKAVYDAGVPELLRMNPFLNSLSQSQTLARMAGLWSPYDLNPLRIDPLRNLLEDTIDFEKLRSHAPQEFLIAATDVATGHPRFFRRAELTLECVLASACLPTVHHAVTIDGRAYWDGGFSANPDIVTLAQESPVADTLIVQLNPLVKTKVPRGVAEITGHMSHLAFNAPLRRDVELICAIGRYEKRFFGRATGPMSNLVNHRFHVIDAGHYTSSLSPQTKIKPDWALFTYLFDAGRIKTERWLQNHKNKLGRRSSVDLEDHFLRQPMIDKSSPTGRSKGEFMHASENDAKQKTDTSPENPHQGPDEKSSQRVSNRSLRSRRGRSKYA